MKYLDEFRQKELARGLIDRIRAISKKEVSIMEICGTHTHAISRFGIRQALPPNIRLISGPGCPVCVTSASDVNRVIDFARNTPEAIIATFGDMMKVPGSRTSLQQERANGSDIRVVYSALGSLDIARENPDREVVMYAVGFETTAPTIAATILSAKREGLKNLSVLSLHKLTPPAMRALLTAGELDIDGFLCPGHVTAIIGARAYGFISSEFSSPCVVAGFEPLDALHGIYMLIKQLEEGRKDIEIQYERVVRWEGNLKAQEALDEVFVPADALWRGIGCIPLSGLAINDRYTSFDAEKRFSIKQGADEEPKGCACGSVLKGLIRPEGCPLFAKVCTPEFPIGPCMVSSEGTCAAFYKYRLV